jgi:hypothetical protein
MKGFTPLNKRAESKVRAERISVVLYSAPNLIFERLRKRFERDAL